MSISKSRAFLCLSIVILAPLGPLSAGPRNVLLIVADDLGRQLGCYGDRVARTVEAYIHRPREELYDLEVDPQEIVNLAGRPEHAKVLADLQDRFAAWQKKTNDPWVIKYEHE